MATRHQVRESVIGFLYAYEIGNDKIEKFIDEILEDEKIRHNQKDFAKELFLGVVNNLKAVDEEIQTKLNNWDFDRIGVIEKSILRLGTYELMFTKVDKAIVINEAIEITKRFGSENSPRFINGVLDKVEAKV